MKNMKFESYSLQLNYTNLLVLFTNLYVFFTGIYFHENDQKNVKT